MGFLDRAIKNGISKGISNAVGNAVKQAVEPKATEYANKVAGELDQATQNISQQTQETAQQAAKATSGLEGAFANLQQSMENYATQAAKNMKICPKCQTPSPADKTFCPNCGTKLPEETLAQGTVCTQCGKQNTIGTKFCSSCGAKLPFAIAEEKAEAEKNADVLTKWAEKMPQYPVWNCGGTDFELEEGEDWFRFAASFDTEAEGERSIPAYRELLKANGFREAGQYPDKAHLYKKSCGICYHVDTEHCFEGSMERPEIWFNIQEPSGGFDYVKPEPKKGFSFGDLFK